MSDEIKEMWNQRASGDIQDSWYNLDTTIRLAQAAEIAKDPWKGFPTAVVPLIQKYMGDLRGKKVCVPSAGDCFAAYGFAGLGAEVLACDIAENQLVNAKIIAEKNGFKLECLCQDSMKLPDVESGAYDLVYTSNGVHVWIDDLPSMYGNFHRVLKDGGYNIFFETHPMIRPFNDKEIDVCKIVKRYDDVLPHDDGLTYAWRTMDFVNAVLGAGFTLQHMAEFHNVPADLTGNYLEPETNPERPLYGKDQYDWKVNPWAALPQCLCLCSQK